MLDKNVTCEQQAALRCIPSIEKLLIQDEFIRIQEEYSRDLVTDILRSVIEEKRTQILESGADISVLDDVNYSQIALARLQQIGTSSLRPVINATGTITHTNLGRALLSTSACESLVQAASNFINLEYDLATGQRGNRDLITEPILQRLTGCEGSTVVNNNAAAVLLALNTLAQDKEVIISRGELIEIGNAFRIPDVMKSSGAILREVGTTNRTHLADYENAITENTGLILKVHPSNYKIVGFSSTPSIDELSQLGRSHQIPTVEDLGSGSLIDLTRCGLPREPVVRERINAGVDIVTFSGDKLLGGPQAGIIVGKSHYIDRIRRNPLMRALRVGKLTIAALEASLRLYLNQATLHSELPMLRCYIRTLQELKIVADELAGKLAEIFKETIDISIKESFAQIGSGSLPVDRLPSFGVVLAPRQISAKALSAQFRSQPTPVIGRTQDESFWIDVRTIGERELSSIVKAAKGITFTE